MVPAETITPLLFISAAITLLLGRLQLRRLITHDADVAAIQANEAQPSGLTIEEQFYLVLSKDNDKIYAEAVLLVPGMGVHTAAKTRSAPP